MTKALADRLAEAFAERLHQLVRTREWGYEAEGEVGATAQQLHRLQYQVRL